MNARARRCRPALCTFVEVAILDAVDAVDAVDADVHDRGLDAAFAAAFGAVARVERLMSFHDRASELSCVNREAMRRPVPVDPWTFAVFTTAADLFARTDGLFDCAVGALLVDRGVLPGRCAREAVAGSFADVVLDADARSIAFRSPLVVDLGGIAKGFAVDRAIDALAAHGVARAVVDAGGDLRVLGDRAVPIHLRGRDGAPRLVGMLADGAFAASTGARDERHASGALVDARSRRFVDDRATHCVLAPTCTIADALTKVAASAGIAATSTLGRFGATAFVH